MTDIPLWESNHPYYCSETNYYAAGSKTITRYESWSDFIDNWRNFDIDMNLIFRWDWNTPDPEDYVEGEEIPEYDELAIYRMGQRKGLFTCQLVKVTKDDEPAVRKYLQPHLDRMIENWAPMQPTVDYHPTFTADRLDFLAKQIFHEQASRGDIDEASYNLSYMAHLLRGGQP